MKHQAPVFTVAFSPDSKTILTGSDDETAQLWDADTGNSARRLKHQGPVFVVAFSPDGTLMLTGSEDRTVRLWDAATAKPVCPPLTHQRGVKAAAFSPDGKTIVAGSRDGIARFWDVAAGRPLGVPRRHAGWEVQAVAFSPDSRRGSSSRANKNHPHRPVPSPPQVRPTGSCSPSRSSPAWNSTRTAPSAPSMRPAGRNAANA